MVDEREGKRLIIGENTCRRRRTLVKRSKSSEGKIDLLGSTENVYMMTAEVYSTEGYECKHQRPKLWW